MPCASASLLRPSSARRARPSAVVRAAALAGTAAAVVATTFVALPQPVFTAAALVGAEGGSPARRPAMVQTALEAAASRSTMARAAAGLAGTAQTGAARLVGRLPAAVRAKAGHAPGTLVLLANDTDAEGAAAMASAVAVALVAELDEREQAARRDDERTAAGRLATLRQTAAAAHARLAALDGDASGLAGGRNAAAARVDALRDRLDAIHAILAAGDPPLGSGRDVPPAIEALQSSYLDLSRQLAKARETLGDRHTTVIGLRDGVARTSVELSAAWKRLAKATEAELAAAKARVAQATRTEAAGRGGTLGAARLDAQAADDALARAEAPIDRDEATRFRLIAAAPVPAAAEGLSASTRLGIAGVAGLATLAAILGVLRRRRSPDTSEEAVAPLVAEPREPRLFQEETVPAAEAAWDVEAETEPMPDARAAAADETDGEEISMNDAYAEAPSRARAELTMALAGALPAIAAVTARAEVPVVMLATNEAGVGTMEAVLALGEAAAANGQRVLIVEGDKARPALAAAVDADAEPALLDVFGSQRIVLRAEAGDGLVYLAPSFRDGARLAADLAETGEVLIADALEDEFDLVVIDGDRALHALEMVGEVDAVLRVGRFASTRDDEHLLETLGVPRGAFLGTVIATAAVFVPRPVEEPTLEPAAPEMPVSRPAPLRMPPPVARRQLHADVRRKVAAG